MKATWRKVYLWPHEWVPPKIEFIPVIPPDPEVLKLLQHAWKMHELIFYVRPTAPYPK